MSSRSLEIVWACAASVAMGFIGSRASAVDRLIEGPPTASVAGTFLGTVSVNNAGLAIGVLAPPQPSDGSFAPDVGVYWSDAGAGILNPGASPGSGPEANGGDVPVALNDAGVIVGTSYQHVSAQANYLPRIARWDSPTATPVLLAGAGTSATGDSYSLPYAINRSGLIIGLTMRYSASGDELGITGAYWSPGSVTPVVLAMPADDTSGFVGTVPSAVNDSGLIVGEAQTFDPVQGFVLGTRAVRWQANSPGATVLGDLGIQASAPTGQGVANAVAVNRAGTIVGVSDKFEAGTQIYLGERPVRWAAGQTAATELQLPAESRYAVETASAADGWTIAINNAGTTIGGTQVYSADGTSSAQLGLRWDAGSGTAFHRLNPLVGFDSSTAVAINNLGTIVGTVHRYIKDASQEPPTEETRCVMWLPSAGDAAAIDLLSRLPAGRGWALIDVRAVSDTGFITGAAEFDPDGAGPLDAYDRGYTELIPEAGTYGLGDATFDTLVNFDDLLTLARNYNKANASLDIHVADFNLDGTVDFTDLLTLAKHYNAPLTGAAIATSDEAFAADWTFAQSLVPEPTTTTLGLLAAIIKPRRRPTHV